MKNLFFVTIVCLGVSSFFGGNLKFFSLFKYVEAQAAESKWTVKKAEIDGNNFIIRKNDSANTKQNRSKYTYRLGFAVPFNAPAKDGRLTPKETSEINEIEDQLVKRLESGKNSVMVLTLRGTEYSEFTFYATESFAKKSNFDEIVKPFKTHKVQHYQKQDLVWAVYDGM